MNYNQYALRQIELKLSKGYSLKWFEVGGRKISGVKIENDKVMVFDGAWKVEPDEDILLKIIERMDVSKELFG
jgi:hypothetical protein